MWTKDTASITATSNENGSSLSLTSDGNFIVIGCPKDNKADAYLYNGVSWEKIGDSLTETGLGATFKFGSDVSVSSDGAVIAVGGPGDTSDRGIVNIYRINTLRGISFVNDSFDILRTIRLTPGSDAQNPGITQTTGAVSFTHLTLPTNREV